MKKTIIAILVLLASAGYSSAKQSQISAKPAETTVSTEVNLGGPVSLEGPVRLASPCNTQDGFINLRQRPNAKSKSLGLLWEDSDFFRVRKVRGSVFYAVLYPNGGVRGYVNGNYICFH